MSTITQLDFHRKMRLGKQPPRIDLRTLKMSKYMKAAQLPTPLVTVDWTGGVTNWGMMDNDTLGDCTCAARGHAVQAFTLAATGTMRTIPDMEIEAEYVRDCGYVIGDSSTDNGGVEIDVLNAWRQSGIGVGGVEKLTAYVAVAPDDQIHTKLAVQWFGGAYIGLQLPNSAQGQSIWDVVGDGISGDSAPGSWGGHAVFVVKYDANYVYVITWGEIMRMTWAFWKTYVDEAYALLSPDFLKTNGVAASGFDVKTLLADMQVVTA